VSIFNIQRHPDFWEQPLVFDPDRFTPERSAGRHPLAFMPFGAGIRKCIGNNLADMEGALLLATVAQHYTLEHVAGHSVEGELKITMRPKYGMPMWLHKR
jgi:cytochrome P450